MQHLTYTGSSSAVVLLSRTPLPEDGQILFPKVCCFTFQSTQTLALTQKSSSKPANLFAFDAPSFHPIYATCLLGFLQHIIIEGRSFDSAIVLLLNTSTLSRHAGIMRFWTRDSVVKECLLKWSHSHTQPWGQPVLYQCPTCKCIQSWDQKGLGASSELSRPLPWWVLHGRGCVLH